MFLFIAFSHFLKSNPVQGDEIDMDFYIVQLNTLLESNSNSILRTNEHPLSEQKNEEGYVRIL
jgi:hypothetical protein